ncbi:MAG: TolB family protein, partial [Anaerolineales bacterium]
TTRWMEGRETTVTEFSAMDVSGRVAPAGSIEYRQWGIGGGQPSLSPDGRYVAVTTSTDSGSSLTLVVRHLESGSEYRFPGMGEGPWSADGKMLVVPPCWGDNPCDFSFGVLDTSTGEITKYTIPGEKQVNASWLPDGSGVVAMADCLRAYEVSLGGSVRAISEFPEGQNWCGGLILAPDKSFGLAGGSYGPLRILDLASGSVREFARAKQIVEPAGKCGGSIGRLVDVLDRDRIIYHESLAAKGSNGITIGDLRTGKRQVLSFWNIADLEVIGKDRVTFTSFEQMEDLSFQLTWLLDTSTGEARPIAVGTGAGWVQ